MRRIAVATSALATPAAALAQSVSGLDCSKAVATVELNACAERDFAKADRELNEVYRAALVRVDRDAANDMVRREWRAALQDAQRKWLAYRDADCKGPVAYRWQGGTGAALAVQVCLLEKTVARTGELRHSGSD